MEGNVSVGNSRAIASMVLRQRTQHRRLSGHPRLARLVPEKLLTRIDATLFGSRILQSYREEVQIDWDGIAPFLPDEVHKSLDIGCGVGGVNEFIYRRFADVKSLSMTLADKDGVTDKIRYGMSRNPSVYNSLQCSVDYLTSVGVSLDSIKTVDLNASQLPEDESFDLIISLISLGFHYPVDVYLDYLIDHLNDRGVLILDCRSGSGGIELLKRYFDVVKINEVSFMARVACTKR